MDKLLLKYELDNIIKSNMVLADYIQDTLKSLDEIIAQNKENSENIKADFNKNNEETLKLINSISIESSNKVDKLIQEIGAVSNYQAEVSKTNYGKIKQEIQLVNNKIIKHNNEINILINDIKENHELQFSRLNQNLQANMNTILNDNSNKFKTIINNQNEKIEELNSQIVKKIDG